MKWVESWYISYALLGLTSAGLVPILLPLIVSRTNGAADIGLVMGAFSLGGLSAPIWGGLADRFRLHQHLLIGGLMGAALGAAIFPFTLSFFPRIVLALLSGVGLASASTVANLFIVEVHPESEWDERIGWLQTFYGGGQVTGLVLAGFIGQSDPEFGLWLAGGVGIAAIIPAVIGMHQKPGVLLQHRPVLSRPSHHSEWPAGSPQHLYHHLSMQGLRTFFAPFRTSFGRFLIAWLLSFSGSAAFFSFYPVLMQKVYGVLPGLSSTGYALAAGLGLILYEPAGTWSLRRGPSLVLRGALVLRIIAFIVLTILATIVSFPGRGWLALLFFLFVVLAWSLLSVSSTALVASLSPKNEGEGMGIFNAVTALSGVIGAVLGGWVANLWGYAAIPIIGIIGVVSGFIVLIVTRFNSHVVIQEHKEVHQ
jgi:DHA1 family tetracycline resistance protein-like MFS transporter